MSPRSRRSGRCSSASPTTIHLGDEEGGDLPGAEQDFDITGHDLERWFEGLATDNVVVILDSCHSGTAMRDVTSFSRARTLARDLASVPRPAFRLGDEDAARAAFDRAAGAAR